VIQRIQKAIRKAGLKDLPDDPNCSLEELGLDSLMMALVVSELEREFQIRIPALQVDRDTFQSPQSILSFLQSIGAQS
jgi:D-alanine--poly(phosphoribitol) ligase subunit 2